MARSTDPDRLIRWTTVESTSRNRARATTGRCRRDEVPHALFGTLTLDRPSRSSHYRRNAQWSTTSDNRLLERSPMQPEHTAGAQTLCNAVLCKLVPDEKNW